MTVEIEVPPNSTASVFLPGEQDSPIGVGAGRYRWSYPYQTPETTLPLLTLDSTLGELLDHPEAYALVMRIIAQHSPRYRERMEGQTEITLRQAINGNPRTLKLGPKIEAALASLGQSAQ
jgi:hypothetical protein